VAIIALLAAILIPALSRARAATQVAVCGSNLRQSGIALVNYAQQNRNFIPRGPDPDHPYDWGTNAISTNKLWIGDKPGASHSHCYTGMGDLLRHEVEATTVFFCPSQQSMNEEIELNRIGSGVDAQSAYFYRHLDFLPPGHEQGRLDCLGTNVIDGVRIRVNMLAVDIVSYGPAEAGMYNVAHEGRRANVLFRDDSVLALDNTRNPFSILMADFLDPDRTLVRADQIMLNADFGYTSGHPNRAPKLPLP